MTYLLWQGAVASAKRHADRPAVRWRESVLTYRELDEQSAAFAGLLRSRGVGAGDRVGLLMPKTPRSVVAMLGILRCGAAYVPVDPAAPAPRAGFILKDCAVRGVVTTGRKLAEMRSDLDAIPELGIVVLADDVAGGDPLARASVVSWPAPGSHEAPPPPTTIESDPAYLLYTSGSTGMPKGVVLSHRHALTFVEWGVAAFSVTEQDRLSNHAPLHFDLSVFDIYVALHTGACVDIVPDEVAPFPQKLAEWIEKAGITLWYSVPSALIRILMHGGMERFEYRCLRTVLFAGEVFPVKYLSQLMQRWPHARYYNLYGPTETNVCTWYEVPRSLSADATEIPIGAACANTEVFALADDGTRITAGGSGELYVRGPALLLGYWNQPEKTADMMRPNPLHATYPEVVYRTGDIVRLDSEGSYWFVGRRDHMVKSRGYRIELGEVEAALYKHDGIHEAVVVAVPDQEIGARLHAFVVPRTDMTEKDVQAFVGSRLPRYMVPEVFWFERELPKTSTGKIDRQSLSRRLLDAKPEDVIR